VTAVRLRKGVDCDQPMPTLAALTDTMTPAESAEEVCSGIEPEPEPEPMGADGSTEAPKPEDLGRGRKQVSYNRNHDAKNVDREPEAKAWYDPGLCSHLDSHDNMFQKKKPVDAEIGMVALPGIFSAMCLPRRGLPAQDR
jgi:hypothetical protein